ncbi:uncharacterized protein LOC133536104 isoform X2 [Nerophis ophidion]|uniref:uncharacterized protein LOC133536104 isoform X2 n=1 Tax=Nerophis ophidion TaxID=159077 RepID=UPI002ADF29E6|nr:uncharacterized protein LOC133536104 isoform X2 [Nerophis ophidion]XP_061732357.1 uncharacterized protein LOC133536104 isoform X2 [Nerophis ophidion]XP_061732367.1 uncharacterized protein LOC133536104 isoform X2 [Nerophis ophidion]
MLQTGNAVTSRNMAGCHIKTSRNRNKGAAGATDCLANVVSIILELLRLSGMSSISRNQTWSTQGYIQHPQSVVPSGGQGERSTDWERRSRKPGLPLLVALSLEVGGGGQGERSTDWERRRRKPSLPLLVALSSEVGGVCGALRCSGRAFHSLGAAEQKARSPVVRSSVLRGWRSWSGRAFHRLGAAEQKARSPIACSLVLGGWRSLWCPQVLRESVPQPGSGGAESPVSRCSKLCPQRLEEVVRESVPQTGSGGAESPVSHCS